MRSLILILAGFILTLQAKSQRNDQAEFTKIQHIILDHFYKDKDFDKRDNTDGHLKGEAFLCLLNTDSAGKINDIHFLINELFADSAYRVYKKLSISAFEKIRFNEYRNKTVVIPIIVETKTNGIGIMDDAGLRDFMPGQNKNLVMSLPVTVGWPFSIVSCTLHTGSFAIIDKSLIKEKTKRVCEDGVNKYY